MRLVAFGHFIGGSYILGLHQWRLRSFIFYLASLDFQRDKKRMFNVDVYSEKECNKIITYFKVSNFWGLLG